VVHFVRIIQRDGSMTDGAAREAAYQPYSNQSIPILAAKASFMVLLIIFLAHIVSCTSLPFDVRPVSSSNHFIRANRSTRNSVGPAYSGDEGLDVMFPRLSHIRKLANDCPTSGMHTYGCHGMVRDLSPNFTVHKRPHDYAVNKLAKLESSNLVL
jgi:hypothetical protein